MQCAYRIVARARADLHPGLRAATNPRSPRKKNPRVGDQNAYAPKHLVRDITRLDRESYMTLFAYTAFLGEPPEYALNRLIETVLAKDPKFLACREVNAARTHHSLRRGVPAVVNVARAQQSQWIAR